YLLMVTMTSDIPRLRTFAERVLRSDRTFKSFLEIYADFSGCIDLANLDDFNLQDLLQREMSASSDANKRSGQNLIIAITQAANQLSDTRWVRTLHTEFAFRCEGHKGNIGLKDSAQSQHEMFSLTRVEALDVLKVMGFDKVFGETMCEAILDVVSSHPHQLPAEKQPADDTIPYFVITRFLILLISEMMPDDEMERMCSERFFDSLDRDVDGIISFDELAENFENLFVIGLQTRNLVSDQGMQQKERFKQVVVKPMHTLILAAAPGDQVTYTHYKNFMEMRIALREHIKESAGTATQNRMLLAEKNHGEQFDRAALDYRNRISSKADAIQSFRILFKRNFHVFRADPKGFKTMVIQIISLTSMYSLLFRDQDRTQDNYTNVVNCIFILCIFLLMIPMNLTVVAFPSEKPIILREVTNGSYDALPFFVAKTIFLCITKGVVPLVVGSVGYFAVGIYPEITLENFLTFLIPIFQMFIWSSMTGLALGILVESAETASAMMMPIITLCIMASGCVITYTNIPEYFVWAYFINMFQYNFSALMVNTFDGYDFKGCESDYDPDEEECIFGADADGSDVLKKYDIQFDTYWPTIGYITLINILTIIGTYALLYSRLKITLVRKANVDVAEEEEARLSGYFGQFLQDFESMCYIFGKPYAMRVQPGPKPFRGCEAACEERVCNLLLARRGEGL
ncbi:hypothetical protein CYMTET_17123, partial [Cymbomonas tetramitiformis]